jgi:hypothetical protein
MNPDRAEKKRLKAQQPYETNRLLQAGTYLLAGASGVAIMATNIWNEYYDKVKRSFGAGQIRDQRHRMNDIFKVIINDPETKDSATIWPRFREAVLHGRGIPEELKIPHTHLNPMLHKVQSLDSLVGDLEKIDLHPGADSQREAKIARSAGRQVTNTIERWYTKNYQLLQRELDFKNQGPMRHLDGTFQKLGELSPGKKFTIAFSGAISIGTVIGAYMLLNQNARLKHDLTDVHRRLQDDPQTSR